jgi:hypothetical protein
MTLLFLDMPPPVQTRPAAGQRPPLDLDSIINPVFAAPRVRAARPWVITGKAPARTVRIIA